MLTLNEIRDAQKSIASDIRRTDLLLATKMSGENQIYLKTENLQVTGSFKARGAANKINQLTEEERSRGIIACSAGNHAQGVARAAQKKGIRCTICMPFGAPLSKVEATKSYGADIVLNPKEVDVVAEVKKLTGGEGANVVFNTTPITALTSQAIEMTAMMGRMVQYSSMHPDNPIEVSPNYIHNSEIIITGSKSPSIKAFDTSARILSKKIVDLAPLLTESYSMEEADKAFERALSPETYRVMIRF